MQRKRLSSKKCKQDRSTRRPMSSWMQYSDIALTQYSHIRFQMYPTTALCELSGMLSRTKICLYLHLKHNLDKLLIDIVRIVRSE